MLIFDLWGISFHAVVVFGLGKNILLKSILGHCAMYAHISRYGEILHLENEFYCDDGQGILQRGTFMNRKITTGFENEAF